MIELIMMVVMPFLVNITTGTVKRLSIIANAAAWRIPVIRAIVAVLSLIGAVLTVSVDGGTVPHEVIETAALTVVNAVVATYLYWRSK